MKLASLSIRVAMYLAAPRLSIATPGSAQEVTGEPGSPSATTTIDGKQLPSPPPKFGGLINDGATYSTPWWPPRIVPPKGAPNVFLIMTDDQGYVIPTPSLDRIAKAGLRYTQFHSTALCSPARAALITGRNHDSVGFGVIRTLAVDSYDPASKQLIGRGSAAQTLNPSGNQQKDMEKLNRAVAKAPEELSAEAVVEAAISRIQEFI